MLFSCCLPLNILSRFGTKGSYCNMLFLGHFCIFSISINNLIKSFPILTLSVSPADMFAHKLSPFSSCVPQPAILECQCACWRRCWGVWLTRNTLSCQTEQKHPERQTQREERNTSNYVTFHLKIKPFKHITQLVTESKPSKRCYKIQSGATAVAMATMPQGRWGPPRA